MKPTFKIMHALKRDYQYLKNPRLASLISHGGSVGIYRSLMTPWIQRQKFNSIVDIGANIGQFSVSAHFAFPMARIYSFEPEPESYRCLHQNLAFAPNCLAINCALGSEQGELTMVHNQFSPASSMLPLTDTGKCAFPFLQEIAEVDVQVCRLDDIAQGVELPSPMLIKVDTQGYEQRVLEGALDTLAIADMVIIETSFELLYEDQPLHHDIYEMMYRLGFSYKGSLDQLLHPEDGRVLQADSIFVARC